MTPSDAPHIFMGCILIPLGLLGFFCFLIHIGIRKDNDALAIGSGLALIMIGLPAIFLAPGYLGFFLERTFLLTCWYIVMGIVWLFLAFFGLKRSDERKGKALIIFAIIWTFPMTFPLTAEWEWSTAKAYLTVFGLTALGYVILGVILKSQKAAKAKEEALYTRLQDEIDTRDKPPWEE